jgi:hypothetical protein
MNESPGPETQGGASTPTGPETPQVPYTAPPSAYPQPWQQPWPVEGPPVANRPPSPGLLAAYWQAVRYPSAEGMASEVPGASWSRVWIGLGAVAVVAVLTSLIRALYISAALSPMINGSTGATSASGFLRDTASGLVGFATGPLIIGLALVAIPGFFLGALFLYWLCRIVGGVGRTGKFGPDFKVHAYLLSLVTVPTSIVSNIASAIPVVGSFLLLPVSVYVIFLQYFVIRASMQLTRNRAQRVIIIEIVIGVVLGTIITIVILSVMLSSVFGEFGRISSSLR